MNIKHILQATGLIAIMASLSIAQTQIKTRVIASGGTTTANESFRLNGTVGQAVIGLTQTQSNKIQSGFWAQAIDLVTSVEKLQNERIPTEFKLQQNYPNPFNPMTTIQFDIPHQTKVTLKIYNIRGEQVDTLLDEEMAPGVYKVQFAATDFPTGVYFYRIKTEQFVQTKKLMLIK